MKTYTTPQYFICAFALLLIAAIQPGAAWGADIEKGKTLFAERCASCHGVMGAGDGPIAMTLPAESRPRNLVEGKFKVATDDAKFKELLQKGGAAMGLNPLMPPAAGLQDPDLESIIAFVHSLKAG